MTTSTGRAHLAHQPPTVWIRYEDNKDPLRELPLSELRLADFDGTVPWRRVRSVKGLDHFSGKYASMTTGGHVVYESQLELARLLLADFDPQVRHIYAQPCRVVARVDGKTRHHVPDFLLITGSGTVQVVNVKPAELLADPKIAQALAWPGELIRQHGWAYEVWSGDDPALLKNVRFLAAYRRPGVVPTEEIDLAWETVQDGEQLASAEHRLAKALDRELHEARPPILSLVWAGRLSTDLTLPLSGEWILRRSR
ncbi:TnsA-like heteromeric transposase endonuclease subunit [Streptomyces sp. NPDC005303]|uniref:TnsA-like heteromeric transposase endonuclease subunit n=1 Tax=Streptomyces sp. NPDC005303 TaxID=3155713 RepID=UPI0033A4A7A6